MEKRISKFFVETLGCRLNRYESEEIAYELEDAGFVKSELGDRVDLYVINSCSVTSRSDYSSRLAARRAKRNFPSATVVMTGCYAKSSQTSLLKMPEIDFIVDNSKKFSFGKLINQERAERLILADSKVDDNVQIRPIHKLDKRTNLYLKIQLGCNQSCSFCNVRIARGKSRSAKLNDVIDHLKRIEPYEVSELILTGVDLGDYNDRQYLLSDLLEAILLNTTIARVRLSSINPQHVDDRLLDLIKNNDRICSHLHIPLQSGSNRILNLMKRGYTADYYRDLILQASDKIDNIGIGTDIMVGFPSESEADFLSSYKIIEELPIMMVHAFIFSSRPLTEAYKLDDDKLLSGIVKERARLIKELAAKKHRQKRIDQIGRFVEVLVENSKTKDGKLKGFTDNYLAVRFDGASSLMNKIVKLKITGEAAQMLDAVLESNSSYTIDEEQSRMAV
ncbi:MAG: tRNA (N(6)-L-threonylcarbamoyladenosine(37)-C(2))-methylthiotransferase MtaB [Nitrospinota bacterium]